MRHRRASRRLSAYLDRELSPRAQAAVERHVARCPRCAGHLGGLRGIQDLLRALPPSIPAEDGWVRLRARMDQAEAAAGGGPRRWRLAAALAAAAGLAAVAALGYLGSAPAPPGPGPESSFVTTAELLEEEPMPLSPSMELLLARQQSASLPEAGR